MTITEANGVALLLNLLDGSSTADEGAIAELVDMLAERAGKTLQLRLRLDQHAAVRALLACQGDELALPVGDPWNPRPVADVPDPAGKLS